MVEGYRAPVCSLESKSVKVGRTIDLLQVASWEWIWPQAPLRPKVLVEEGQGSFEVMEEQGE